MDRYDNILEKLLKFRHERDWEQFHTPKNVSMGLSIEASEVMQEFLWKTDEQIKEKLDNDPESVADELADVASYLFLLCHDAHIDIFQAMENKIRKNAEKYPVSKCKGRSEKYTEL